MKPAIALLSLAMLAGLPQNASAWGAEGHRTVGMIADIILEQHPVTRGKVNAILDGVSLSDASVWADCAKGFRYCHRDLTDEEKAYVQRNPNHHDYHYTDVPIQQTDYVEGTAGTKPYDVVQLIRYGIKVLSGQRPNDGPPSVNLTEKEALWVLVHLVGDIHQPLHVGAAYFDSECVNMVDPNVVAAGVPNFGIGSTVADTVGGNDFSITSSRSLHAYWDDSTVIGAMRLAGVRNKSIQDFADALTQHPPAGWQAGGDLDGWSAKWASEILPMAKDAIMEVEIGQAAQAGSDRAPKCTWPVTLDRDYSAFANKTAEVQLAKAGFRLAALLVEIFEGR